MKAFTGQKDMSTWVIEVTEFDSEARFDLRGHLEAENGLKLTGTILPQNMSIKVAPGSVAQQLRCGPLVHKFHGPIPASGKARFRFFSILYGYQGN